MLLLVFTTQGNKTHFLPLTDYKLSHLQLQTSIKVGCLWLKEVHNSVICNTEHSSSILHLG